MTGAEAVAAWFAANGITQAWAVQGGTIAAVIDACDSHPDITVRFACNEISAGYACDGANRASGRAVAAALVCAGPGEAQLEPAIEAALADGVPVLAVSGAPRSADDFQRRQRAPMLPILRFDMDRQFGEHQSNWLPLDHVSYVRQIPRCFLDWVARVNPVPSTECRETLGRIVDELPPDALVFSDSGVTTTLVWTVLGERLGDRLHVPWSQSPLGAAIPMAAGAAAATNRECVAIVGDGSFDYQVAALGTLSQYGLPVRVVVLDNAGYEAIKMFQRANGFAQRGVGRRLFFEDFDNLGATYGIDVERYDSTGWHEGDR